MSAIRWLLSLFGALCFVAISTGIVLLVMAIIGTLWFFSVPILLIIVVAMFIKDHWDEQRKLRESTRQLR